MSKVIFEYALSPYVVQQERMSSHIPITKRDIDELKSIANGKIFIFFLPERNFIIIESGIYDYLLQLKNVIESVEMGYTEISAVSCDYYSNNLKFNYTKETDELSIYDGNIGAFTIKTKYKFFKKAFLKFEKEVMRDLLLFYPELAQNENFK